MTTPAVQTIKRGGSRFYVHPQTNAKVPGVTSITGNLPKPFLQYWGQKLVAEEAVDSLGSKGNDVKWVQHQLNRNGFNLTIDGHYGWLTWRATRMYQRRSKGGLTVDGIVGPKTVAALLGGALS